MAFRIYTIYPVTIRASDMLSMIRAWLWAPRQILQPVCTTALSGPNFTQHGWLA